MSVFVAICPKCRRKVSVPRPGSMRAPALDPQEVASIESIESECPFCGAAVCSKNGFEVSEPKQEKEEFDLLSVG